MMLLEDVPAYYFQMINHAAAHLVSISFLLSHLTDHGSKCCFYLERLIINTFHISTKFVISLQRL